MLFLAFNDGIFELSARSLILDTKALLSVVFMTAYELNELLAATLILDSELLAATLILNTKPLLSLAFMTAYLKF